MFVIICPRFGALQGQIQIYHYDSLNYYFDLIYEEQGNSTNNTLDYFNIGSSVDLIEQNKNHMTLFFTSIMQNGTQNYTFVNHVQIFTFATVDKTYYFFQTIINDFRDRSDDTVDLGRIGLSLTKTTMLLSLEK